LNGLKPYQLPELPGTMVIPCLLQIFTSSFKCSISVVRKIGNIIPVSFAFPEQVLAVTGRLQFF